MTHQLSSRVKNNSNSQQTDYQMSSEIERSSSSSSLSLLSTTTEENIENWENSEPKWRRLCRQDLIEQETNYIINRTKSWETVINRGVSRFLQQLSAAVHIILHQHPLLFPKFMFPNNFAYHHLQYLREWSGLKPKKNIPKSYNVYKTRSKNWLRSKSHRTYDKHLYPMMIEIVRNYVDDDLPLGKMVAHSDINGGRGSNSNNNNSSSSSSSHSPRITIIVQQLRGYFLMDMLSRICTGKETEPSKARTMDCNKTALALKVCYDKCAAATAENSHLKNTKLCANIPAQDLTKAAQMFQELADDLWRATCPAFKFQQLPMLNQNQNQNLYHFHTNTINANALPSAVVDDERRHFMGYYANLEMRLEILERMHGICPCSDNGNDLGQRLSLVEQSCGYSHQYYSNNSGNNFYDQGQAPMRNSQQHSNYYCGTNTPNNNTNSNSNCNSNSNNTSMEWENNSDANPCNTCCEHIGNISIPPPHLHLPTLNPLMMNYRQSFQQQQQQQSQIIPMEITSPVLAPVVQIQVQAHDDVPVLQMSTGESNNNGMIPNLFNNNYTSLNLFNNNLFMPRIG